MGWASGGDVFDSVAAVMVTEMKEERLRPDTAHVLAVALIRSLRGRGWDTEDESLREFGEHPVFVAAFAECGIVPQVEEAGDCAGA